jgi:hypothetical protein
VSNDPLDDENRKLRQVIKWALGEFDDFPDHPVSVTLTGNPKYWWRKELKQRYQDAITVESAPVNDDVAALALALGPIAVVLRSRGFENAATICEIAAKKLSGEKT